MADVDFEDPDRAYLTILESLEYLKRNRYHDLTKEYIIDQAEGLNKKVFDQELHKFAGHDFYGRPIVVLKIRNIDTKVFSDLQISRLYMLYQVEPCLTFSLKKSGKEWGQM